MANMKFKKTDDFTITLDSLGYNKKEEKKKISDDGFNPKYDYYITLSELLWKIQKNGENLRDNKKSILFSADFVRIKKRTPEVEYHKGVRVKYIACSVNKKLQFEKLDKRVKVMEDEKNSDNVVYFIPVHFLRSLIPSNIARGDNMGAEIADIGIFRYTGDIEQFRYLSIFDLAQIVFMTKSLNTKQRDVEVIV